MQNQTRQNNEASFIENIQDKYTSLFENRKDLRKALIILLIITTIYLLIYSYVNYKISWFLNREIWVTSTVLLLVILSKVFHKLFGKWFIHETRRRLTIEFIKEKFPRSIKFDGPRGVGKDSTVNALRKIWREDIIEQLEEEMLICEMVSYPYDFDKLNKYLDEHKDFFMTNSKNNFFFYFIQMMKNNNCFIKKYYSKNFSAEEHLQELYLMKRDPGNPDIESFKYKYNNGITTQHYLSLLIKYSIIYIRLKYLDNFLISNQPTMETEDMTAKVFSTRFTNIQKDGSEWPWPIDGNVIIIETESDAFYPNKGMSKGSSPMKSGLRNFKAVFRHLFGELSVWINIGQKASRTEKSLRELDHAFVTIIEQSKVLGGEKRIYFIEKYLSWVRFWANKSIRKKSREKQHKRRSKIYERITQLENSGYIYIDLKVSRSDYSIKAEEMSLKKLLSHDKAIFENYMVKLCFHIKDCYRGYNSVYLESLAEMKAKKSKLKYQDTMNWDPDLVLKKKHIEYMAYDVLNSITGTDRKKTKKVEDKPIGEIQEKA